MYWRLTYFGTEVARALWTPDAYKLLDRFGLDTWSSGGCAVLAYALYKIVRGPATRLAVLVREDGTVDHVVFAVNVAYVDSDGAYTAAGMVDKLAELEGVHATLRPMSKKYMRQIDFEVRQTGTGAIWCPPQAVDALAALLQDQVDVDF